MTKTIALSLVLAASLGLAACSKQETTNTVTESNEVANDIVNHADGAMMAANEALDNASNAIDNAAEAVSNAH